MNKRIYGSNPLSMLKLDEHKNNCKTIQTLIKYRIHLTSLRISRCTDSNKKALLPKKLISTHCKRLAHVDLRKRQSTNEQDRSVHAEIDFLHKLMKRTNNLSILNFEVENSPSTELIPLIKFLRCASKYKQYQNCKGLILKWNKPQNLSHLEVKAISNAQPLSSKIKVHLVDCTKRRAGLLTRVVSEISKRRKLHHLELYSDLERNEEGVRRLMTPSLTAKWKRFSVLTLNLSNWGVISKEWMEKISKLNSLQELYLDLTRTVIDKQALTSFSIMLASLHVLKKFRINFSFCPQMCEEYISQLSQGSKKLKELKVLDLNFDSCASFDDRCLTVLSDMLLRSNQITDFHLNLSSIGKITNNGISYLSQSIAHLQNLQRLCLTFRNCHKFSTLGAIAISDAIKSLIDLQELDLDFGVCRNIENQALIRIANSIKQLNDLKSIRIIFNRCPSLQDDAVDLIVLTLSQLGGLQKIELDLSYCSNLNKSVLGKFSRYFKNSRSKFSEIKVDFFGCPNISTEEIRIFNRNLLEFKNRKLDILTC